MVVGRQAHGRASLPCPNDQFHLEQYVEQRYFQWSGGAFERLFTQMS